MGGGQGRSSAGRAVALLGALLLCLLLVVNSAEAGSVFLVGDNGWTFNMTWWPSTKRFQVGDQLLFKYTPPDHSVAEVDLASYNACIASGGAKVYTSGHDLVTLSQGTSYFICVVPGHCEREPLDIQTYSEMVKKAQLLEDATDITDRIKGKFVKKEMTSGQSFAKLNNGKNHPFNITEGSSQERKPKVFVPNTPAKSNCKHCEKSGHTADECWRKVGACLHCGSCKHRIPECPLLKEHERHPNAPKKHG
ncbi:hypothetical protein Taro_029633 [Colocasia esculenta]|uniref:Phytocyanin domain-containing protein n=1 Tax=Colocasia esculenta TaxID=4460 RepID=A0A843VXS3_COLES|nr:hypothetical protein [Colocasia esculenta]